MKYAMRFQKVRDRMSKEIELLKEAIKILEEREKTSKVQLSTLKPGETFKVGEHDFIVLKQGEEVTRVISKDFMAESIKFDEDTRDYKKSNLKKVIERDIQPLIEKEVGADNIIEHEVDLTSVDMQNEFGKCKCKVRPITFDEAREFNDLIVNENLDDWSFLDEKPEPIPEKTEEEKLLFEQLLQPTITEEDEPKPLEIGI